MPIKSFSVVAALTVAAVIASSGAALAQTDEQCQITRTTAEPSPGDESGTPAVGQLLSAGDRVSTNATGRATITCDTGLTITIGGDTVIILDRVMTPNRRGAGIRLLEGIAGFLLPQPRSGGFEVRTPSAVAAVRSTEWAIEVDQRATAAFVRDGAVTVTGSDCIVLLSPGEGVDVSATGNVGQVVEWGAGRVAGFNERLGPDWQTPAR